MIFITGDTHRNFKHIEEFCYRYNTTTSDYMIILGDAGINYSSEFDIVLKGKLSLLPITLFCIQGNHERRPYVGFTNDINYAGGYEIREIDQGDILGKVYVEPEYSNLWFAVNGETYKMNSSEGWLNVLVCGGAYSVDKYYRLKNNMKWFAYEQPTEFEKARTLLAAATENIDVIMTHTCPKRWIPTEFFLDGIDQSTVDNSTEEFLDMVLDKVQDRLGHWYFGHYHGYKEDPNHMYTMLYHDIEVL